MFEKLTRKFFKVKENRIVSENELLETAKKALESKSIENDEHELIESVLAFGDTLVREVMTPRPDIVSVPDSFNVSAAMEVAVLNGFSRVPVSSENLDEIVGVVFAKDMMEAQLDGDGEILVKTLARLPQFIPETKKAGLLLREMQSNHYHLAIVVDEYGGTAGLVTLDVGGGQGVATEEYIRAMYDGLRSLEMVMGDGGGLLGGGTFHIAAALHLRELAEATAGRHRLAIEAFSRALEAIPVALASNAGEDQIDTLLKLRAAHRNESVDFGVSKDGSIGEINAVLIPATTMSHALQAATETACGLLRVDQVISSRGD